MRRLVSVVWTELLLLVMVHMGCSRGLLLLLVLDGGRVVLENLLVLESLVKFSGGVRARVGVSEQAIHAEASADRKRQR